jgi:hypothetical protein
MRLHQTLKQTLRLCINLPRRPLPRLPIPTLPSSQPCMVPLYHPREMARHSPQICNGPLLARGASVCELRRLTRDMNASLWDSCALPPADDRAARVAGEVGFFHFGCCDLAAACHDGVIVWIRSHCLHDQHGFGAWRVGV